MDDFNYYRSQTAFDMGTQMELTSVQSNHWFTFSLSRWLSSDTFATMATRQNKFDYSYLTNNNTMIVVSADSMWFNV